MTAFHLSAVAQLDAPSPLRTVIPVVQGVLLTGGTNGVFHKWTRNSSTGVWSASPMINGLPVHGSKFVCFCVASISDTVYISGGSDTSARIWDASGVSTLLNGHSGPVNSVVVADNNDLITGSYDGTAIIWRNGTTRHILKGHSHGVEVSVLNQCRLIVTGSGSRSQGTLRIWNLDSGVLVKTIEQAHQHVIRRIKPHPRGFVTCGNDGYVKLWSQSGEVLWALLAHPAVDDKDSFVYGLDVVGEEVVSIGEDCAIRVISASGELMQTLVLPSPARDVTVLPNGDFATAGSDGVLRVFTRDNARLAPPDVLAAYNEYMELVTSSGMSNLDQSQVQNSNVLNTPGTRHGQTVVVESEGVPYVHQWDSNSTEWVLLGEAVGQRKAKPKLDGVEYDHVVHLDVGDGQPQLPLGFNRDEDPHEVAESFVAARRLDPNFIPEIAQHLVQFADPVARLARLEREQLEQSSSFSGVPCWKTGFHLELSFNPTPMHEHILASNSKVSTEMQLNPLEINTLNSLLALLKDTGCFHMESNFTDAMKHLILKLLHWPVPQVLAVLDMVRVCIAHSGGNHLAELPEFRRLFLALIGTGDRRVRLISIQLLFNWLAKRLYRSDGDSLFLNEALAMLEDASRDPKSAMYNAYTMLLFK